MWNMWSSCLWVLRIVHSSTAPSFTRWSMREGSKILPSTVKVYSCQWPATSFSGEVAPGTSVRRPVISLSRIVSSGGLGSAAGALPGRHQQLLHLLQGAQLDAVTGDDVQPVLVELQQHVVLVLRRDQAPALHLPRPRVDGRPPLAVDRQEARRGFRKERTDVLDHGEGVEHDLRQQDDALARLGDLRHVGEIALDDDGAGHAACNLHIGRAVEMRMVPVGS